MASGSLFRCWTCLYGCMLSRVWIFVTPWNYSLPARLLCPWNFPGNKMEWVAISFSRGSSQPRIEPRSLVSPALSGGFLTTVQPGKPIQVVSMSLSHALFFFKDFFTFWPGNMFYSHLVLPWTSHTISYFSKDMHIHYFRNDQSIWTPSVQPGQ